MIHKTSTYLASRRFQVFKFSYGCPGSRELSIGQNASVK